jgi:hypothetical protein
MAYEEEVRPPGLKPAGSCAICAALKRRSSTVLPAFAGEAPAPHRQFPFWESFPLFYFDSLAFGFLLRSNK